MSCRKFQNQMAEVLYDELEASALSRFEEHLENCAECQSLYGEMKEILQAADQTRIEPRDEAYWAAYWNKLEARLPEKKSGLIERIRPFRWIPLNRPFGLFRIPAMAGGAAVLLLMGIFIGKQFSNPEMIQTAGIQAVPAAELVKVQQQTGEYIGRAKTILLGFVNTDPADSSFAGDISLQQSISRDLVNQAPQLKLALKESNQLLLLKLVNDLEMILLQIANLEQQSDVEGVELIRSGAEHQSILFKINVGELMLSDVPPAREPNFEESKQI